MAKPEAPKQSAISKELEGINKKMRLRYIQKVQPLESAFIRKTMRSEPSRIQDARGAVNADVQQLASRAEPQVESALQRRGAAVNSGQGVGAITSLGNDRAIAGSTADMQATNDARGGFLADNMALAATGDQQKQAALRSYNQVAQEANRRKIVEARAKFASRAAMLNDVGGAVGYGVGALANRPPTNEVGTPGQATGYGHSYAMPDFDSYDGVSGRKEI